MTGWNPPRLMMFVSIAIALVAAPGVRPAAGQERPASAAEFAAGTVFFADDGVVTEGSSDQRFDFTCCRELVQVRRSHSSVARITAI